MRRSQSATSLRTAAAGMLQVSESTSSLPSISASSSSSFKSKGFGDKLWKPSSAPLPVLWEEGSGHSARLGVSTVSTSEAWRRADEAMEAMDAADDEAEEQEYEQHLDDVEAKLEAEIAAAMAALEGCVRSARFEELQDDDLRSRVASVAPSFKRVQARGKAVHAGLE